MKDKAGIGCGLIMAIGLPLIALVYVDWRAALAVLIIGQGLIYFAKLTDLLS